MWFKKAAEATMKLIGESKNGVKVFREFLEDGTIVTKSFKNGKPFKEVRQMKEETLLAAGYNPKGLTYKSQITTVLNHETGVTNQISKFYDPSERMKIFMNAVPDKSNRTIFVRNGQIIKDSIWKRQPSGGTIEVIREPHISSKPSQVRAYNYTTPSGKTTITGVWDSPQSTIRELHFSYPRTTYENVDGMTQVSRNWGYGYSIRDAIRGMRI